MPHEIVVQNQTLQIANPYNEPVKLLWESLERMPNHLPSNHNAVQFMTAVVQEANACAFAVEAKGHKLNAASLRKAAFNTAALGLMPGDALGHAYFVPFKGVVQLIVGYRGFLDLAFRNNFLKGVNCEVVLQGEEFRRWNDSSGPQWNHEIDITRDREKTAWDEVVCAYCQYETKLGFTDTVIVNKKELDGIKRRQTRGKNAIWADNPIPMALKTPLRRASNRWQFTRELSNARMLDEQAERGDRQASISGESFDDQPAKLDLNQLDEPPEHLLKDYPES